MAKRKSIEESLAKLAAAEEQFLHTQFLAPVAGSQSVQVRIAGVRCSMNITPRAFTGWGVFRPVTHRQAALVRPATFGERQRYLHLFPSIPLILCFQDGPECRAIPASRGDTRIATAGLLPVRLVEGADTFDTIRVRFDGAQFWFDAADARSDPSVAGYLRESLAQMREPAQVARSGMTVEQSAAYAMVFAIRREVEIEQQRQSGEGRLKEALTHAGAVLREFAELGDAYRVRFEIDGRRHTSVVRKDDLTVQAAGICLSGEDDKFDLHSLVGVIREGEAGGSIYRVGI